MLDIVTQLMHIAATQRIIIQINIWKEVIANQPTEYTVI